MLVLYPELKPYQRHSLKVSELHELYIDEAGNPDGIPVLFVHGGPGGGCDGSSRLFYDPALYRIVTFDQRGCGRSRPHASVEHNTTWHLVADIERIREVLGIGRWTVFGGSWGATLALIYAETHPEAVRALVLRGVFMMTQAELRWFYGGGAGQFWPETWQRFADLIPEDEQDDMIAAYHKRLFSGNLPEETRYAKAWSAWENALASVYSSGHGGEAPGE